MNRNILIVLGGGFAIALLVAIIVQASLGNSEKPLVEIVVAAQGLNAGTTLDATNVQWKSVPEEAVSEGSIRRQGDQPASAAVKGRLRRDVAENEPVLVSYLITEGKGNVLAVSMQPGMRAMAIKASAESMVGGFINPGDHVDVILSYEVQDNGEQAGAVENPVEKHATETVLENVKILAIDQTARKDDNSAVVGRTVTLEVDQRGAEKLALVTQMGELSLSLRGIGDTAVTSATERRMTTDVQISPVLREINRNKRRTGGTSDIMRIYSGDTVENINVRR